MLNFRLTLFACAAAIAVFAGCDRSSTTAVAPASPDATDQTADERPSRPPHTFTFAQRIEQVDGTPNGQRNLATLMNTARASERPEDVADTLAALGRKLGQYRGAPYTRELADAARLLTTSENPHRHVFSSRLVVPLAEMFVDLGDRAALERLVAHTPEGAGSTHLSRALGAATSGRETPAEIRVPSSCALSVDGELLAGEVVSLPAGSHWLSCGALGDLVLVHLGTHALSIEGDRLILATDEVAP